MANKPDQSINAQSLSRLSTAYAEARILHSAVDVGVFEFLARGPASENAIQQALGLHARFTRDFLATLAALGLLERVGDRYRNSAVTAALLVPGGPVFLGGRVKAASTKHYHIWGRLTEALRDGKPKVNGGPITFQKLYADAAETRNFLIHMDANNGQVAQQLAEQVDWTGIAAFVDIGGARGNVAAHLVNAHPHLRGGVFELPAVEPFFVELMVERGTADRVKFHGGDFFADPLPATDVMIFGHVLHDWSGDRCLDLLERAREALNPRGSVVIYDQMLDEEAPDLRSLLGSLNVGLITEGGGEYTVAQCRSWLDKSGFAFRYAKRLSCGNDTVVVAVKE
jgi:hypothetical protein